MDERELRVAVEELQYGYARCIDSNRLEEWPEFFTDPCVYQIMPRENAEQDWPIAVVYCDSQGMLQDRVVAHRKANLYAPHSYRHLLSGISVLNYESGVITAHANYAVYRTLLDAVNYGHSELFSVGEYRDTIVVAGGKAKFREKTVLVDTARILSLLVTPL
ncbi:MAG: aromatic-ring-hydroxylating dioxygenase subunit beta [Candidatus Binatia bacterium]